MLIYVLNTFKTCLARSCPLPVLVLEMYARNMCKRLRNTKSLKNDVRRLVAGNNLVYKGKIKDNDSYCSNHGTVSSDNNK